MGRKNGNKASQSRRRPQARKRLPDALPSKPRRAATPPPVPLERMVLPVGKCGRKIKFGSEIEAYKALKQARQNRAHRGQKYVEGRVYHHPTCGGWHLTSMTYEEGDDNGTR